MLKVTICDAEGVVLEAFVVVATDPLEISNDTVIRDAKAVREHVERKFDSFEDAEEAEGYCAEMTSPKFGPAYGG